MNVHEGQLKIDPVIFNITMVSLSSYLFLLDIVSVILCGLVKRHLKTNHQGNIQAVGCSVTILTAYPVRLVCKRGMPLVSLH